MAFPNNKMSEETKEKIRILWNDGASSSEIGKQLGLTRNSIIGAVFRMRKSGIEIRSMEGTNKVRVKKPRPLIVKKEKKVEAKIGNETDIFGLKSNSCRFIVKQGNVESTMYCNNNVSRGPYCEKHYQLCYVTLRTSANRTATPRPES